MLDTKRMEDLAGAVADGRAVDLDGVAGGFTDPDLSETAANLRAIASIGRALSTVVIDDRSPDRPTPLPAGSMWGTLRVLERVGSGRFGDVYRAWDPALDREVALKIIASPPHEDPGALVVDEGRLMARVHHPNVIAIFGAQRIGDVTGLWMEFVRGESLAAEFAARGPFGGADLAEVGLALCGALQAVHDAGLVHRDVKAQNVLRDSQGRIVLGDFGTGRDLDAGVSGRRALAGTPAYVAPELFEGARPSPQTDLYSLGVLLFYLATGTFPASGHSLAAIRNAHDRGVRGDVRRMRPDLPDALQRAIDRALAADPESRFPDARSMAAGLTPSPAIVRPAVSPRGWLSAVLLILVTSLTIGSLARASRTGPVAFAARDWVLVTDFDNRTGDPLLDGTLEFALARELATSAFVNVVPVERIHDALRLMRRDPDTPIDRSVGREIALRDGGVRLLVAGRAEKIGPDYLLTAELITPGDGTAAWGVTERVRGADQLIPAVRSLSMRLRSGLGEARTEGPDEQLLPATTSSLRALQLYSQAMSLGGRDDVSEPSTWNPGAAAALLAEALTLDPDFALAHLARAEALSAATFDSDRSEQVAHLDRAEEASRHSTDAERLLIQGVAAHIRAATSAWNPTLLAQAAANFEALERLQPGNVKALRHLSTIYRLQGRGEESSALHGRLADLLPHNPGVQLRAAMSLADRGDVDGARDFVERVRGMDPPPSTLPPPERAWLALFPAHDAWFRDDVSAALRFVDLVADAEGSQWAGESRRHQGQMQLYVLCMYLTLGQLDRAERFLLSHPDAEDRDLRRSMVLAMREDRAALGRFLRMRFSDMAEGRRVGSYWFDAGLLREARVATALNPVPLYLGQLALAEERYDDAVGQFQLVARTDAIIGSPALGRAVRKLADALVPLGRTDEAIDLLERIPRARAVAGPSSGFEWLLVRDTLAELYLSTGRVADANRVDAELERLLAVADLDHPILRRLAERRHSR
jgi:serine/threonine protein kinase/tetratricopeptide (TPR) repeat protein